MEFKNNKLKIIRLTFILIVLLVVIFIFTQIGSVNKNNKKDVIIDIPSGSSVSTISDILYENKLIKNKTLFKLTVKISNKAPQIKAGKYLLNQTYTNNDIVNLLASGKIYNDGIKITIPEGSTSKEIISILVNKKLGKKEKYEELINNPKELYNDVKFLKENNVISLEGFLYPETYYFSEDKDVIIDIPSGSSVSTISDILYENKLIKNKTLFKLTVKISNKAPQIKAGKYLLNQAYTNNDIVNLLASGKIYNDGIKITIPEGSTSKEIISILVNKKLGKKEKYEELINNPKELYNDVKFLKENNVISLEGFLYPETYYFSEDLSETEILKQMLIAFDNIYNDKLKEKQKKLKMSLEEVITLASIVEKEAVKDEDRPLIAGVFYNRLKIDMPLQSDATIQYIFEERKKIVTYNDLKIDSPYNSYKNKGLPPTPIANPGIKSIEATLYPTESKNLYFVATVDGGNNYSETYEQHLKYVKEYKEQRDKLNKEKK